MKQFLIAINQATNRIGKLSQQAEEAIQQATLEARNSGKPVTVTTKITIRPLPNKPGVMGIGGSVTTTLPKSDGAMYDNLIFSDQRGNLHLNSPQSDAFDEDDLPDSVAKIR